MGTGGSSIFVRVVRFYVEGFRSMTLGRTLWALILLKLFVMFAILKVFFFPDMLAGKDGAERAESVLENLLPAADAPYDAAQTESFTDSL